MRRHEPGIKYFNCLMPCKYRNEGCKDFPEYYLNGPYACAKKVELLDTSKQKHEEKQP